MSLLILILLVLGLACFIATATRFVSAKVEVLAIGLALWIATDILGHLH